MPTILPIPGYLGYYASDEGRVFSTHRHKRVKGQRSNREELVELGSRQVRGSEHVTVRFWYRPLRKITQTNLCEVILTTFVGPCPEGMGPKHLDGDILNNRLDNLQWSLPDLSGIPELFPTSFPGYSVSRDGRVWSYRKSHTTKLRTVPRELRANPVRRKNGTLQSMTVVLPFNNERGVIAKTIHSLMLETFVGPRPDGMFGCHWDDNPANNKLENLRWASPIANSADAVRNGKKAGKRKRKLITAFVMDSFL